MSDLFPSPSPDDIRALDKVNEIKREIAVRQRVYPRWVSQHKITERLADYRIIVLQAILRDYQKDTLNQGESNGNEEKRDEEGN